MSSTADAQSLADLELVNRVRVMLEDAHAAQAERRLHDRTSFFTPVFVSTEDGQTHTGFTRDVSRTGISLLHRLPIEPQRVNLLLTRPTGGVVEMTVNLTWCNTCGEGWYISGGGVCDAQLRD